MNGLLEMLNVEFSISLHAKVQRRKEILFFFGNLGICVDLRNLHETKGFEHLNFKHSNLFRISIFGFRILFFNRKVHVEHFKVFLKRKRFVFKFNLSIY